MDPTDAPLPDWFWIAVAFVFGANVGSFLNVVIARVPYGESIVWPPSHCRACGKAIRPLRNVPILSWFMLRGRCENCLARFSFRYAFVELVFALVCAFAVARHGVALEALFEVCLVGWLLCLSAIDLDHWILPHELTWSGIAVALGLAFGLGGQELLLHHLFGAAVGYTSLLLFAFIAERVAGREAMGGGDPWLFGMLGAFLGASALLPIILLASVQGSLIGIAMIAARRKREAREAEAAAAQPPPPRDTGSASGDVPPPGSDAIDAPGTPAGEASTPDAVPPASGPIADEEDWVPPPTGVPFGPFLALGGLEVHYFERLRDVFALPF
ncbi:MAG: prepilin peptidase [Myxococcales bacterium]